MAKKNKEIPVPSDLLGLEYQDFDGICSILREYSGREPEFFFDQTYYYGIYGLSVRQRYTGFPPCGNFAARPRFSVEDHPMKIWMSNYRATSLLYIHEGVVYSAELTFDLSYSNAKLLAEDDTMRIEPSAIIPVATVAHPGRSIKESFISIKEWKKCTKLTDGYSVLINPDEAWRMLNPYQAQFCKDHALGPEVLILAPQLEQLYKSGFGFAYSMVRMLSQKPDSIGYDYRRRCISNEQMMACFSRLTKPGKNLKEIFKTGKPVYQALKDEDNLATWDIFRKLFKTGKIEKEIIEEVYFSGYTEKDLNQVNSILNKTYDGKPVFTWHTLQNYLGRLDMYEAIGRNEAFQLLSDYLYMCNQLNMRPRIDGDSLKREHDVAARMVRQQRDEIRAEKMQGACDRNQSFNYKETVFFARAIQDYDDLLDEAKQQHNCVGAYADSIAANRTKVFVVRQTARPDKSLVTLELSPDCTTVRQKLMAYNKPIRNKALQEFIERFRKHAIMVKEGKYLESKEVTAA